MKATARRFPVVVGKVSHTQPIFVDAFTYLASVTTSGIPKITIPGPGMASFMGGRAAIDQTAYPDLDQYWADLIAAYRSEIAALYAAGCRYLQLDDVSFAYLCDPDFREQMAARGDDADQMITQHRDAMNAVIADRPDDLLVSTHMCRGNFKSRWVASGGYEPIAERVFGGLDVDAFFLEFDSERAGGFEPLRYLAPGKTAVLGLITTKTPELEPADELRRRIDEAAAVRSVRATGAQPAVRLLEHASRQRPDRRTISGASSSWSSTSAGRCGADLGRGQSARLAAHRSQSLDLTAVERLQHLDRSDVLIDLRR